jgi:hypothetical protein
MAEIPHDIDDLRLAPVLLHLDERLSELGCFDLAELAERIALTTNLPDWDEKWRRDALLEALGRDLDLGGWALSWDPRGLRVSHGLHHVVLGVPASLQDYAVRGAGLPNR